MSWKKIGVVAVMAVVVGTGCPGGGGKPTVKVGDEALSSGNFDNARDEFLKVLKEDPNNTDALSGLVIADALWVVDKLNNILTNSLLVGALTPQADIPLVDLVLTFAGTNLTDLSERVDEMDKAIKTIEDVAGKNFIRDFPESGVPVKLGKKEANSTIGDLYLDVRLYGRIGFPEIEGVGAVVSLGKAALNLINSLDTVVPSTFITNILQSLDALSERLNNDPIGLLRMLPHILAFGEKENFLCWNPDSTKKALYFDIPTVLSEALTRLSNMLKKSEEVFGPNPVDQDLYLVGLYDGGDKKPGGGDDTKPVLQSGRDYLRIKVKGEGRDTLDRDFDGNDTEIIQMGEGGVEIRLYFPSGFNQEFLDKLHTIIGKLSDILSKKSQETKISLADINDLIGPLNVVKNAQTGQPAELPNVLRVDIAKLFAKDVPCIRELLFVEKDIVDPYDNNTKRMWLIEGETMASSVTTYAQGYVKTGDSKHFEGTEYEIEADGALPLIDKYPNTGDFAQVITSAIIYAAMKDPSLNEALEIDLCPLKDYPNTTTAVTSTCTPGTFTPATQFSFNNILAAFQILFEKPYLKIELPEM